MSTTTSTYGLTKHVRGDTPWDVEVNADLDTIDTEIGKPRLPQSALTWGATTTVDCALARLYTGTNTQITTIAFSNVPTSTWGVRLRLLLTNGGAFAITWPASVVWLAGIAPSLKASGVDEIELLTRDGGTTWYATLRNLRPGVIYQTNSLTTTSGVDASLGSYVLPAGTLAVNGQAIRVTVAGLAPAGGATLNAPKFGATGMGGFALGANAPFVAITTITRTGAATQFLNFFGIALLQPGSSSAAPAETLANAITIDFRGNVTTGGQTLTYHTVQVELLARA